MLKIRLIWDSCFVPEEGDTAECAADVRAGMRDWFAMICSLMAVSHPDDKMLAGRY